MLNNARRTYWATVLFLLAPLVLVPWVAAAQKQTTGKTWQAKRDRKLGHTGSGSARQTLVDISARLQAAKGRPALRKAAPRASTLNQLFHNGGKKSVDLAALRALGEERAGWDITWHERHGTPVFIDNKNPLPRAKAAGLPSGASPADFALAFIETHSDLFGLQDSPQELKLLDAVQDRFGRHHVKFQQQHQGIPVWGHDVVLHLEADGSMYALNARYGPMPQTLRAATATTDAARAIDIARSHLAGQTPIQPLDRGLQHLLKYKAPRATQYFWEDPKTHRVHLVWHVEIRPNWKDRWYYFIDAHNGQILQRYNATQTDGPATATATDLHGEEQTINVYEVGEEVVMIDASKPIFQGGEGQFFNDLQGVILTLDARNADLNAENLIYYIFAEDNTWPDPVAVSAHVNTGKVFDYFFNVHNRRGIDNEGGTMTAVVHVTDGGELMDNAFWNGAVMAYGDGQSFFDPLAGSLDVAAHEMTHGIIERTVGLEYIFQSGALNESLADIFGVMVDNDDWLIGEDVVQGGGFLRSIDDPNQGGQPAHMDEFRDLDIDQDNGGVHINSGIPNRACFLIADAIGREKTEQIYYRIIDARYLNIRSNFVDMRLAAQRAATDLFGDPSAELNAVIAAFDAVGIVGEGAAPDATSAVEGEQWILIVNAEDDDNSLFLVRPVVESPEDIVQLTETQVFALTGNSVSIVDDGSLVLFVDADNFLRLVSTDGEFETVLSEDGEWFSIALSPDGSKLAATTVFQDTTLFILDLDVPDDSKAIRLYNPTSQEGVTTDDVLFADAMDWDLSSQYVVYDAFNAIPIAGGDTLAYWNVNLLDVEHELIIPLFAAQGEGFHLANPSFSSTSDDFMVFDFLFEDSDDPEQSLNSIWVYDLFSGAVGFIEYTDANYSFPRFSPDDRFLIYEFWDEGVVTVRRVPLTESRLEAAGPSEPFLIEAQTPIWFAIGERIATAIEEEAEAVARPQAFDLWQNYPNPFNPQTTIRYALPRRGAVALDVYDAAGRRVRQLDAGLKDAGEYAVRWDGMDAAGRPVASGVYFYRLRGDLGQGKSERVGKMVLVR